jgi:hypothetical protein
MSTVSKLVIPALLAMSLFFANSSSATPTSTNSTWSFGGLFVATYVNYSNGDLGASFENSAGTLFTGWNDQNGVAQCPGASTLRMAAAYGAFDQIQKTLLAAALSHKSLHVWFEATSGVCYIKQLTMTL